MLNNLILILGDYGLLGVFLTTLIAYSIIPLPSEAVIIGASLILNPFLVLLVALTGATLGTITNYYIGIKGFRGKPPEQNETAVATAVVEDPEGVIRCPICKDFTTESAFGLQAHLRKHVNESRKKEVKQT